MALITSNAYGSITVADDVVASIASRLAMECYGVVDLTPRKFSDTLAEKKQRRQRRESCFQRRQSIYRHICSIQVRYVYKCGCRFIEEHRKIWGRKFHRHDS